jgi:hypothetical protein
MKTDMKTDIITNIIHNAGSVDNLMTCRQEWETENEYMDGLYDTANDLFMDSIEELELTNYDDIKEETISEIINLLMGV